MPTDSSLSVLSTQALQETAIAADHSFWPGVAEAILRLAERARVTSLTDLRGLDVILPGFSHAPALRAALHGSLHARGHPDCIAPRLHTVDSWAGSATEKGVERRIELFDALRASEWVRASFGSRPAALWTLAGHIEFLCDELTLAAVDGAEAFASRLQDSLARHFFRRASRALQPQAQLVLQLWRASRLHGDGAAARLAALRARSEGATRPLLFVAARPVAAWTNAWLMALSARVAVHVARADVGHAVAARPLLAAAWPELVEGAAEQAPIADRAGAIELAQAQGAPVLVEAHSLEETANTVCEQVLAWLQPSGQGDLFAEQAPRSIALVAIDRAAARRVRALLERARVLVRDETGWKLSTTSAAAAVMALFDLAANGFHHRDLLAWLKSPFTFAGLAGKSIFVERIERVIRSREIVQGLGAVILALQERQRERERRSDAQAHVESVDSLHWLRLLESHVTRLGVTSATMAERVAHLDEALAALAMRPALTADPVGAEVLRVLDDLRDSVRASATVAAVRVDPTEFRALVATRFEEAQGAAGAVDSPVAMVSLAAAALRDFDAAALIGVDASHLPALPAERLFFSNAVRADLGLDGTREAIREQGADLAALLARVPRVLAVWCAKERAEPRVVAGWFARLRAVARAAGHDPLQPARASVHGVVAAPTARPAPGAPALLRPTLSASDYQSLVNCPYQFYARDLLGLRLLEEVTEDASAREYGDAIHEVLALFHERWRDVDLRGAAQAELEASLAQCADAVFAPKVERRPRLLALRQQFSETAVAYLAWLRQRTEKGWRFVGAEVEARTQIELDVQGGRTIELVGRIDRIDRSDAEVEVLDYKSRRRQQLADELQLAGESVQLPFYGLLRPDAARAAFVFLQRTSDRQEPVGTMPPRQPFGPLVEALRARLRSDLRRIATGAALPALGNEIVCGWCEMRGLCRRDFWQEEEGSS